MKLENSTADPSLDNFECDLHQTEPATPDTAEQPGDDGGYVQVIVNLTPRAYQALKHSQRRVGDTKTDTINRSIVVYDLIQKLIRTGGGNISFVDRRGRRRRVQVY